MVYKGKVCEGCGGPVSTKESVLCRKCWMIGHMAKTSRPVCQVCGRQISWIAGRRSERHIPKRCRDCYVKEMKANPPRLQRTGCDVPGCPHPHKALGLCKQHYASKHRLERTRWSAAKKYVALLACCLCGYDRMRSHVHRLKHQGGYEWGNIVPVCQRCHDEIISGITEEPASGVEMPDGFKQHAPKPGLKALNAEKWAHLGIRTPAL